MMAKPEPTAAPDPRRCPKTESGRHVPDWVSITLADDCDDIADVACRCCGRSGSFVLDPDMVDW